MLAGTKERARVVRYEEQGVGDSEEEEVELWRRPLLSAR